ncbi:sialate O-acetylesterase [Acrasis kona]|uniref:Sialate O-acetylesterase n=1 Tax=Acrasis kona TaxID=1008807 RepID=A0AAW2ZI05_9EUKA
MIKIALLASALLVLALCQDVDYKVISDNMVLQRDSTRTRLWGTTTSDVVNVQLRRGNTVVDTYEAKPVSGRWELPLKSYPAGGPFEIFVKATTLRVYRNVVFGDVYLCSGQSNMEMSISQTQDAEKELQDTNYPNLRVFRVIHNDAKEPVDNVQGVWKVSSPSSLTGPWDQGFSAACYYFGRRVFKALNGEVPIGLIESNWGGTRVETWMSPDARKICNDTFIDGVNDPNEAGHMWNGQIVPLLKYNIKAALWYQGESNAGDERSAERYTCSFPQMISDWRAKWNVGDFPFYFVQIAGWNPGTNWPVFRLKQLTALKLQNTYFVTAIDIGDPTDIHPQDKQEVGRRLSLIALNQIYKKDVHYKGPTLKGIKSSSQAGTLTVRAELNDVVGNLTQKATPKCTTCCELGNIFKINTNKRQNVTPKGVKAEGNALVLEFDGTNDEVLSQVDYAMYPYPQCVYIDSATLLPVNSFRAN